MQPPGGKRSYETIVTEMLQRLQGGGVLTDVNPGSVVRTLTEAFAREMAEAYARLSVIYEMGFIDTATGESLDHLVALLGQERVDGLQVVGEAIFSRDARVLGRVVIPEGTTLQIKKKGTGKEVAYRTTREAELPAGQSVVTVPIAADVPKGEAADQATLLPEDVGDARQVESLAGIGSVTIPRPTAPRGNRETDDGLRQRVKGLINAVGGGTTKAMERAILATGKVSGVVFRDAAAGGAPALQPGELEVVVDLVEGDLSGTAVYETIWNAINAVKGPGVLVRLKGISERTVSFNLKVKPSAASLSVEKRQALRRAVEQAVSAAVTELPVGQQLLWNPLQAKVLSVPGVLDIADGTVISCGGTDYKPGTTVVKAIPAAPLGPLERLVLPRQGAAVTVTIEGETVVTVRLKADFTAAEPASAKPDASLRAAIARAIEAKLQAKNGVSGDRNLTYADVAGVATGVPGAGPLLKNRSLRVLVRSDAAGAEGEITAATPFQLGPDEVLYPHPDGPDWGDMP